MNKHILMVQGWLLYPESYTKEQLDKNYLNACEAACEAAWSAAACEAVYFTERAEYWLNEYFKKTDENRQDYIDAINKDNKQ